MERLYAVEPDEFMAERRRLAGEAKSGGDKTASADIGRLRKPSLAGWAVNLVAREAPTDLAGLLAVGEKLRRAQSQLDMATLQALRPDRDAAVDGFVAAAVRVCAERDRELRGGAQQEVRDTAIAAIADAGAAAVVASGLLVRALSYSGFGEVDVSDAVARTSSGAVLTVVRGGAPEEGPVGDDEPARQPVAVDQRARAQVEAEEQAAARADRLAAAQGAAALAEQELADAEMALTDARRRVKAAERARDAAAKELAEARRR